MMPPRSVYFIQALCDRCETKLSEGRMMSFFSNETICLKCARKEEEIREKIRRKEGADADLRYQGCGFLPKIEVEHKIA
jgi:hypothetical protein